MNNKSVESTPFFTEADLVSCYTRKQALENGTLVDVTKTAKEARFTCPVAVTSSVWSLIEAIPQKRKLESIDGRLWDVLSMLMFAIRAYALRKQNVSEIIYKLIMHNTFSRKSIVYLKAVIGAGDNGEMVITIMLPDED